MKSSKECTYPNHWLSKNSHGDLRKPPTITDPPPTHWASLMGIRRSCLLSFICWMDTQPCADGGGLSGEGEQLLRHFDSWCCWVWFLHYPLPSPVCIVSSNPHKTTLQLCSSKAVPFYQSPNYSVPQGDVIEIKLFCSSWGLPPKS